MRELKIALRERMEKGEGLEKISVELINKMINDFGVSGDVAKEVLFSAYRNM